MKTENPTEKHPVSKPLYIAHSNDGDAWIEVEADTSFDAERRHSLYASAPELLAALKSALRYIEVQTAYQGAMTADEVEAAIKGEFFPAVVSIGANSCNTLATFDFTKTRALVAKATGAAQ